MTKPIPTRLHGVLDYLSAGTLLALPRVLGWSTRVTNLLTGAALGTLGASLLTQYELGLVKVVPVKGHLILDGMSGALLAGAPFLLLDEADLRDNVTPILVGLGLFEIAAALLTRTQPAATTDAAAPGESTAELVRRASERWTDQA